VKISTFTKFSAINSHSVIQAFISGARKIGIDVVDHDLDADAALIWSVLWHGRMSANQQIYHAFRNRNRPVFVLDVGTLIRNRTWKLAVNNINSLGYYGHLEHLDLDRPNKLGIKLSYQNKNNGKILICLQHIKSHQIQSQNILNSWINHSVEQIQNYSSRQIVLRPHPRCRFRPHEYNFNYSVSIPGKIKSTYDCYDFAPENYHCIVNYNSGPGITAALRGVRPIVDSSSLAHPAAIDLADIEKPYTHDRSQWLISISHTEYTLEELESAIWEKRLQYYLT